MNLCISCLSIRQLWSQKFINIIPHPMFIVIMGNNFKKQNIQNLYFTQYEKKST